MKNLFLTLIVLFLVSCNKQEKPKTDVKQVVEQPAKKDSVNNKFNCYDGNQTEMNECSAKELNYFDSIMNVKYKSILSILDEKIKEDAKNKETSFLTLKNTIIDSQKNWVAFKTSNIKVYSEYYKEGSIAPMAKNSQATADTKNRIKFLEIFEEEINK